MFTNLTWIYEAGDLKYDEPRLRLPARPDLFCDTSRLKEIFMGIHPKTDIQRKNAELGYWLAEPYWRKGIVTRAVKEMVDFAFNTYDINRVFARPLETNKASQKVLENTGFKLESKLDQTLFKNSEFLDELVYAIRR